MFSAKASGVAEKVNILSSELVATQNNVGWNGQPARALDGNTDGQWRTSYVRFAFSYRLVWLVLYIEIYSDVKNHKKIICFPFMKWWDRIAFFFQYLNYCILANPLGLPDVSGEGIRHRALIVHSFRCQDIWPHIRNILWLIQCPD